MEYSVIWDGHFNIIGIAFQIARHINVILSPFYYEWYLAYDRELHVSK